MAKKKSASKQETTDTQRIVPEDTTSEWAGGEKSEDSTPQDTQPAVECDMTAEISTTGEVDITERFIDTQMMGRLRANILSSSELYREAQIFASQDFNVPAMLKSDEPTLVQNTLEILRIADLWYPDGLFLLTSDDERTRELAEHYVLHCIKNILAPSVETLDALAEIQRSSDQEGQCLLKAFYEKLRPVIVNAIVQQTGDTETLQTALSRLCMQLDISSVEQLLCDPSPAIRISVIRSLSNRTDISLNTMSVILILLKDRNEKVNLAVMKLCAKMGTYPELVIPQVLPLLPNAGRELAESIDVVLRCYGDSTVEPVMTLLEDTSEQIFLAVRHAIALAPQRYTDALLKAFLSIRTRDFVKDRIAEILRYHKDTSRIGDISRALALYKAPERDAYPQWTPPETSPLHATPVLDNKDFYTRLWDDKEISSIAKDCDESAVIQLMADASQFAQINALHVIKARGEASAVARENIAVWLKSSQQELADAAMDTWIAVNHDPDTVTQEFIETLIHTDSQETQKVILHKLATTQDLADATIREFYKNPMKLIHVIGYMLNHEPTKKTIQGVLNGLDRSQSVACIAETLTLLLTHDFKFDNKSIRRALLSLLREPVSYGQYGLETRLRSLELLGRYMLKDKTNDRDCVTSLQAFQKECKNAELRNKTKTLLKNLGEEVFDFEDEDDDFEDLNDEEDEF